MGKAVKDITQFYHLTSLNNMESIIRDGLLPRESLTTFEDVADPKIIEKRNELSLNNMVPFHFFIHNPFDGRVMKDNPDMEFVYLCISRNYAKNHNWKILPRHPLACQKEDLKDYDDGFNSIDWLTMEKREYQYDYGRAVCMAEALSPTDIPIEDFLFINVRTQEAFTYVNSLLKKYNKSVRVSITENYFIKRVSKE